MKIYILFTSDAFKTHSSRVLRGAFTDEEKLTEAERTLIRNKVIDSEEHFEVITLEENEFEPNGGYY